MRCEHCEYLLFNLMQPACPECGRPFDHERYRFEPGSVSFNCPHCDQEYYGNDQQGLPYPREFVCIQCGQALALWQLRVVPRREDAFGEPAMASPWDRRKHLGTAKAWWQTFVMTLFKPGQFYRTHHGKSVQEAWLFAMIAMYIGMVAYALFSILVVWGLSTMVPAGGGGGAGLPMGWMVAPYVIMAVIGPPIAPFLMAGVYAAFIQLALLLLAPCRKSIGHTFHLAMYACGPYALYAIPACGGTVGGIWVLITLIVGVKEVHQISGWRAAIAVLWPVVLLLGFYLIFTIALVWGLMANA